jgi:hypothetical protein
MFAMCELAHMSGCERPVTLKTQNDRSADATSTEHSAVERGLTTLEPYRDWEIMTSSYLQQPLVPFAVALSQMLENIEADLADGKLGTVQAERLRWRAELIRSLLTPSRIT